MKSEFLLAFNEICESRSLSNDVVLRAIESALVSAFRRNVGVSSAQRIVAQVDPLTGTAVICAEKEVVEIVQDERTEVALGDAHKYCDDTPAIGDMLMVNSTPLDFGRIAAQTAKQVILQRIREAEREQLYENFSGREGEIINGTVQSVTSQAVTIGLGRTEALLPRNQQVPGERYHPHDKVRAYVLEVRRSNRGPQIIVSRSHRNMLRRMLELEVPEIYNGLVDIKNVAREAGQRSKVAVAALQDGVDPVGACVGMRGVRIQSIVRELNDEKIDVIEWNVDPRVFIAKALSPARVAQVYLRPDARSGKTATVIVANDQLSLAIGREGQNARLAAKLTGWRIDIKSLTESASEALTKRDDPLVAELVQKYSVLVEQSEIILARKAAGRPITAEDFQTLNRIVGMIEGRFAERKEAERKGEEQVRKAVPAIFWQMPLVILELGETLETRLVQHGFRSVGDVVSTLAYRPEKLRRRGKLEVEELAQVQERVAATEFPKTAKELARRLAGEEEPEQEAVAEPAVEEIAEPAAQVEEGEPAEPIQKPKPAEPLAALYKEPPPEIQIPAPEPKPKPVIKPAVQDKKPAPKAPVIIVPARRGADEQVPAGKKKRKKKGRDLVYDEKLGSVVAKRRRKPGRRPEWDEPLD